MKTCEIKEAFGIDALTFAETREVLKYMESAAHFGKIVITV